MEGPVTRKGWIWFWIFVVLLPIPIGFGPWWVAVIVIAIFAVLAWVVAQHVKNNSPE